MSVSVTLMVACVMGSLRPLNHIAPTPKRQL
jgi:hypothetical protein